MPSGFDNFFIYAGMAFLYGVIGTVIGIILSLPTASAMATAMAPISGTYIDGFKISATGIIVGVILGLGFPVLAAFDPGYARYARLHPQSDD